MGLNYVIKHPDLHNHNKYFILVVNGILCHCGNYYDDTSFE
jgi:hypothetical protein